MPEPSDGGTPAAALNVSSSRMDFGAAVLGTSVPGVVEIHNDGDAPQPISAATITGPDAASFGITANTCLPISGVGSSCSVALSFSPVTVGSKVATLVLEPPVGGTLLSVALAGNAIAPGNLTSETSNIDFGAREVGSPAAAGSWTLVNRGDVATGVLQLTNSNSVDFPVSADCGVALAAGAMCTVSFNFAPGGGGARQGTLLVSDGELSVSLRVLGTGAFRLTVIGVGDGAVSGPGIDCGPSCETLLTPQRVALTATTQNGANSFFAGWSEPTCPGPARACNVVMTSHKSVTARFLPMTNNLVFVTSTLRSTDEVTIASGDSECNRLATNVGINDTRGNGFISALSDEDVDLVDRLSPNVRGWVRLDGKVFADTHADLFGCAASNVRHGINFDEVGRDQQSTLAFTTSDCSGRHFLTSPPDCIAQVGLDSGPRWLFGYGCSVLAEDSVICLGATKTAPLVLPPPVIGKRIWVTRTAYVPGSMTPDAKCQLERPPGVAQARALVAFTDRAARVALDDAATYVRSDGIVVGTGAQLAARDLRGSGIWQFADGTTTDDSIMLFTGAPTLDEQATPNGNCNDWNDPNGSSYQGIFGHSTPIFWDFTRRPQVCTPPDGFGTNHLYCVEP